LIFHPAVIESSPEQEECDDIAQLDIRELSARHYEALAEVQQKSDELQRKSEELFQAQSRAWRLTKKLKTMQSAQTSLTSPAEAMSGIQMEKCD